MLFVADVPAFILRLPISSSGLIFSAYSIVVGDRPRHNSYLSSNHRLNAAVIPRFRSYAETPGGGMPASVLLNRKHDRCLGEGSGARGASFPNKQQSAGVQLTFG
jgi:hypothetical protein